MTHPLLLFFLYKLVAASVLLYYRFVLLRQSEFVKEGPRASLIENLCSQVTDGHDGTGAADHFGHGAR